jgi:hypothetical protein
MPTVPTYNPPQVREQALQPVFQNAAQFSGRNRDLAQLGQGLQNLGDSLDRIDLRDAQAKASQTEAEVTAAWLQWDGQARQKYRGQNADGYQEAAETWWKEARNTYGADLDPRSRRLASDSLIAKRQQAMSSVINFSNAEKERHADEAYGADINTTIQFGIDTGNPDSAAMQLRQKTAELGARKGWTTEQVQNETTQQLAKLHGAQLAKLLDNDAEAAQQYYDAAKARGEIPAQAQARMEEMITNATDSQFATQFAAQNATKPYAEQLEAAGEIDDPKRREKTLLAIKNQYALIKEAQRAQEEAASDQAWQLAAKGQRIPEVVLSQMDGKERMQLQESMRARAERVAAGKPVHTDMPTYIDVRQKLANGERVNLSAYTEKIGPAQMEQLLDIQDSMAKGGVKQDTIITDEGRINNALVGMGIDKKKNPEAATTFTLEVDRRVRAESAAKGGKDLTADEKQRIVDTVMMDKVYVDEWGRDPEMPVTMVEPDDLKGAYVLVPDAPHPVYGTTRTKQVYLNTIPATDRAQIISALKKRGMPVTEQNIAQLYLMNKKGK